MRTSPRTIAAERKGLMQEDVEEEWSELGNSAATKEGSAKGRMNSATVTSRVPREPLGTCPMVGGGGSNWKFFVFLVEKKGGISSDLLAVHTYPHNLL